MLGGTPDEALRIQESLQVTFDRVKVGLSLDTSDEIVLETELLDLISSLVRQDLRENLSVYSEILVVKDINPDLLVRLLSVTTFLNDGHDNVLSSHERQLLGDTASNNLGVNDESFRDVLQSGDDNVRS